MILQGYDYDCHIDLIEEELPYFNIELEKDNIVVSINYYQGNLYEDFKYQKHFNILHSISTDMDFYTSIKLIKKYEQAGFRDRNPNRDIESIY